MLIRLDFLPERIWVSIHQQHDSVVPFLVVGVEIVAAHAVAAIAGLVQSKAIAVKLQAFGLLAVANHSFARIVFV